MNVSQASLEQKLASCQKQVSHLQEQLKKERKNGEAPRESRKNLLNIFDGFPEPLFLLDCDAKIQMLNKAASSYCHTDYSDAVGKYYTDLCAEEEISCSEYSIPDMVREGRKLSFERKSNDRPERIELVSLLPLFGSGQVLQGAIFRIQDITEKEKMNEQMILADRLASLSQLSSGFSHEIRNPLASIMLFVDILADQRRYSRSEQELEILAEVKENVQRITDIITRVFDYARPGSSNKVPSDINKLLEDILRLWAPKINRASIETKLSLQPDIPLVTGDSGELQQVLSNLILNAIEAIDKGGTLTITTKTALSTFHKNRQILLITVKDTGKGIPDNLRNTIFNPFFSTKPEGAGLGLTISYQIIKRHGGVLSCNKSGPEGTLFSIELPLPPTMKEEKVSHV